MIRLFCALIVFIREPLGFRAATATSLRLLAYVFLCVVASGCSHEPEIRRYSIDKPAPPPVNRLLAAMIPQGQQAWFFKLTGKDESVARHEADFKSFVGKVRFSAENNAPPSWTLPSGWREMPGTDVRFATLQIESERPALEVSVTVLPLTSDDLEAYTLSNVNRWRDQLQLPPLDREQLDHEVSRIDGAAGPVTLVNFVGRAKSGGMQARAPLAPGDARGADSGLEGRATRPATSGSNESEPVTYERPEGWQPAKGSGLSKLAFAAVADDQRVEITLTDLTVAAGDRLSNINRWRTQVGLAEITPGELSRSMSSLEIDGATGSYVELVGPESAQRRQTILGVIVEHGEKAWFIKLKGDATLAAREKQRFETFVQSLKFKN